MARVLVIAQDPTIRGLLEIQLRILGHELVSTGATPPSDNIPDCELAIVDADAEFAHGAVSPLIFVSSGGPPAATRRLGPAAHLTVPFSFDELADAIGRAIRRG